MGAVNDGWAVSRGYIPPLQEMNIAAPTAQTNVTNRTITGPPVNGCMGLPVHSAEDHFRQTLILAGNLMFNFSLWS
jgi:hypothetical protein